jgi:hypothetical protein
VSVRRSAELFGDNGAHGPRAPIDEAPAYGLGYASTNRAVGQNEQLTSRAHNRAGYALALNTDDLDDRLLAFESGGLDTVYRLGLQNVAGGGRVVHVDGGAVELQATAPNAEQSRSNALLRANLLGATTDTVVGVDIVSRQGGTTDPGAGIAAAGLLERRLITMDTARTSVTRDMACTLNSTGGSGRLLTLNDPPRHFSEAGTGLSDLGGQLLAEVTSGPHRGLYLAALDGEQSLNLSRLDGSDPSFAHNAQGAVSLYVATLITRKAGLALSGIDAPEPGGSLLALYARGNDYALVMQAPGDYPFENLGATAGLRSDGTFQGGAGAPFPRRTMGAPSFYAPWSSGRVGFAALEPKFRDLRTFIGAAFMARATDSVPVQVIGNANLKIRRVDDNSAYGGRLYNAQLGSLLQLSAVTSDFTEQENVELYGTFLISEILPEDVGGYFYVNLQSLTGEYAALEIGAPAMAYLLEGAVSGRRAMTFPDGGIATYTPPADDTKVLMSVHLGPDGRSGHHTTGLALLSQRETAVNTVPNLLLRGNTRGLGDVFVVTDEGEIYCKSIKTVDPLPGVGGGGGDYPAEPTFDSITVTGGPNILASLNVTGGIGVTGNAVVGGNLEADDISALNLTLGQTLHVVGATQLAAVVATTLQVADEPSFPAPKQYSKSIPLAAGIVRNNAVDWQPGPPSYWSWNAGQVGGKVCFPIDLPTGAIIQSIKLGLQATTGHVVTAQLHTWFLNLDSGARGGPLTMRSYSQAAVNGVQRVIVPIFGGAGQLVLRDNWDYQLTVMIDNPGAVNTSRLDYVWIQWTMPGIRQG